MTEVFKTKDDGEHTKAYLTRCGVKHCNNEYYSTLSYILSYKDGCPKCGVIQDRPGKPYIESHKNLG